MSDDALVLAIRQGSEDAFEIVFNRYWERAFQLAYVRLKSREESEEVVQEVFASLWKNRETACITRLYYYILAAVRNQVLARIRTKILHRQHWDQYSQYFIEATEATAESVAFDDLQRAMESAIDQLPAKTRQVFRLNRLQGVSIGEIAEQMNMPRRTIEYHLTQSLRKLQVHLRDFILLSLIFLHP